MRFQLPQVFSYLIFLWLALWLDTTNSKTTVSFPVAQYQALQDLYFSTNGPKWSPDNNPLTVPWNFSNPNTNPCLAHWQGIVCNPGCFQVNAKTCYVINLALLNMNLVGFIPNSIGNITTLNVLNLGTNFLYGTLPSSISNMKNMTTLVLSRANLQGRLVDIFQSMTNLTIVDLSVNSLSGSIPSSLYSKTNLEELNLKQNQITGNIDSRLCCTAWQNSLRVLNLEANNITGSFPDVFYSLTQLETLALNLNQLEGSLKDTISQWRHLQTLTLDDNKLTGTIPKMLSKCVDLQTLSLSYNQLHGDIPDVFNTLTQFVNLQLSGNMLTGTLPVTLTQSSSIILLAVANNLLHGTVASFANAINMLELNLFGNEFTAIPPSVNLQSTLLYLYFARNQFTGGFPSINCDSIIVLDIHSNYFTGQLPSVPMENHLFQFFNATRNYYLGSLPSFVYDNEYLNEFYFSDNMLSGSILDSFASTARLNSFFVGNNFLTGSLPSSLGRVVNIATILVESNAFHGTIPSSYFTNYRVRSLLLHHNHLTGTIPVPIDPLSPKDGLNITDFLLGAVDLSNNELTGSIPAIFFQMIYLESFAASMNCFQGSIPEEICGSIGLVGLSLDGLSTSDLCHKRIFSSWTKFKSYIPSNTITGTFPNCLLSMPSLKSLHISGNGIHGTFTHDVALSDTLEDLILSHNNLRGTIPVTIQLHPWQMLDLSYNRFKGSFQSNAFSRRNMSLFIEANRLSGDIPDAVYDMEDLAVLSGNLFTCPMLSKNLPRHDPKWQSYVCGSNNVNQSLVGIAIALSIILATIAYFKFRKIETTSSNNQPHVAAKSIAGQDEKTVHIIKATLLDIIREKLRLWRLALLAEGVVDSDNGEDESRPRESVYHDSSTRKTASNTLSKTHSIYNFYILIQQVQQYCMYLVIMSIVILLPMLRTMTYFVSTYETKYLYDYSAIYLTGSGVAATLFLAFTIILIVFYYLFAYRLENFDEELQERNEVLASPSKRGSISDRRKSMGIIRERRKGSVTRNTISATNASSTVDDAESTAEVEEQVSNTMSTPKRGSALLQATTTLSPIATSFFRTKTFFSQNFNKRDISIGMLVMFVNVLLILLLNCGYVAAVLYVSDVNEVLLIQIVFAAIKLLWNDYALWWIIRQVKEVIQYFFPLQHDGLHPQIAKLLEKQGSKQISSLDIFLIMSSILFNNLVAPCISVMVVNPSCFYHAFVLPDPETSNFEYCSFYQQVGKQFNCRLYTIETSLFQPPFEYSYECSGRLLQSYAAVFVYMLLMGGIAVPVAKLLIKYILDAVLTPSHKFYDLVDRYLPLYLRNFQVANPYKEQFQQRLTLTVDRASLSVSAMTDTKHVNFDRSHSSFGNRNSSPSSSEPVRNRVLSNFLWQQSEQIETEDGMIFCKHRFALRVLSFLALMVSFGMIFPLLSMIAFIAIISNTTFEIYNIGRILHESKALGYHWYREQLQEECQDMVTFFTTTNLSISMVASYLFAFIIFDTIGDAEGKEDAFPAMALFLFVPFLIALFGKVNWYRVMAYMLERGNTSVQESPSSSNSSSSSSSNPLHSPIRNTRNSKEVEESGCEIELQTLENNDKELYNIS